LSQIGLTLGLTFTAVFLLGGAGRGASGLAYL